MRTILARTFVFFVTLFVAVHLSFYLLRTITYFSWTNTLSYIFILGILGFGFAFITILLAMTPLQLVRRRFSIRTQIFYGLYFLILIFVVIGVFDCWREIDMPLEMPFFIAIATFPCGPYFYKTLGTLYSIEVLSNYLIVLTAAIYLDRKITKATASRGLP